MVKLAIVIGGTPPAREALDVANWVLAQAGTRTDATFEILDAADFNLPLVDEPVLPSQDRYSQESTRKWAASVEGFDGFVFVTPDEAHGSWVVLKNALDHVNAEWNNKAAGFVSYGTSGGARAVAGLRLVMAELQIADVRGQVILSSATDFDENGSFKPAVHQPEALQTMCDQLVAWSEAMRGVRTRHDWLAAS